MRLSTNGNDEELPTWNYRAIPAKRDSYYKSRVLSHNCGGSKTSFSGIFRVFEAPKVLFSIANRRSVFRISNPVIGLRQLPSIRHAPQVPSVSRPNATENRPNAPFLCHLETLLRHFATLLRPFVQDAKVDLRRIVCDFLTSGNRVGIECFPHTDHRRKPSHQPHPLLRLTEKISIIECRRIAQEEPC